MPHCADPSRAFFANSPTGGAGDAPEFQPRADRHEEEEGYAKVHLHLAKVKEAAVHRQPRAQNNKSGSPHSNVLKRKTRYSFAELFLRCLIQAEFGLELEVNRLYAKYKDRYEDGRALVETWLAVRPKTKKQCPLSIQLSKEFHADGSGHDASMSKLVFNSCVCAETGFSPKSAEERWDLVLRAARVRCSEQVKLRDAVFTDVTHIVALRYLKSDPTRDSNKSDAFRLYLKHLDKDAKVLFVGDANNEDELIKTVAAKSVVLHFSQLSMHLKPSEELELHTHGRSQLQQLWFYIALGAALRQHEMLSKVTVVGTQSGLLDVIGIAMGVSTVRYVPSTFDKTRTEYIQGAYGLPIEWREF